MKRALELPSLLLPRHRAELLRPLFEAIEAWEDALEAVMEHDGSTDPDPVVEAEDRAHGALDDAMTKLVPTDGEGRWPWESEYGQPLPKERTTAP